ncbi:MAG: hypothetical protein Q8O07_02110 [Chloroflexota bacterium]|nr:hypothetical protein [Chloroflexota bacterium]
MIPPSFILAVLMGSMIGLAFFYAFGRKADNMFACWLVGVAAFLVGQLLGAFRPVAPFLLGEVHMVEGAVVSLIALAALHFARR